MEEKTLKDEVRGIVLNTLEGLVPDGMEIPIVGLRIKTDDRGPLILHSSDNRYSKFSSGQRVVCLMYVWKRPATPREKHHYWQLGLKCPDEVEDHEYVVYDELSYDQETKPSKKR